MKELLLIAVGSAFVNNVVLSQFLGICPFLGVSKNVKTVAGMGGAVVFVITIASFVTGLIYKFILGNPNIMGRIILPEYNCIYSCNRRTCTVCRDVLKESDAIIIQCARCISSVDHNELCSSRSSTDKRTEWLL